MVERLQGNRRPGQDLTPLFSILQEDNEPVPLGEWDGMAGFELKHDDKQGFTPFNLDGKLVGLSCHHACYTLLINHFRYKLKLRDVQSLQKGPGWEAFLMDGDYGGILSYQCQVGEWHLLQLYIRSKAFQGIVLTNSVFVRVSSMNSWIRMEICG